MMLQIDADGKSDIGKVRQVNQDAFSLDKKHHIYLVADGMGGHAGGDVASWKAVETALTTLRQFASSPRGSAAETDSTERPASGASLGVDGTPEVGEQLVCAIQAANEKVFHMAAEDRSLHGMGTTLVALCIRGDSAYVGSVGDSRVYMWRNQQLRQITHDHSLVNEYVRLGTLSSEEAASHPLKHIISRAVGVHATVEVDHFTVLLKPDDLFVLCSDGLTNMLDNDELASILRTAGHDTAAACNELIARANAKGGLDNITIAAVRCVSV